MSKFWAPAARVGGAFHNKICEETMSRKKRNHKQSHNVERRTVRAGDLFQQGKPIQGHIQHKTLSPSTIAIVRRLYERVGHLVCPTLEQWELGYMRDVNLKRELAVWGVIADAFEAYQAENPNADKKKTLAMLSAISTGGGPKVETAESERLRQLFQRFVSLGRSADSGADTVTMVGIADCHGLELFDPRSDCLGALYYILGSRAIEALPALRIAAKDQHRLVRASAKDAIDKIVGTDVYSEVLQNRSLAVAAIAGM